MCVCVCDMYRQCLLFNCALTSENPIVFSALDRWWMRAPFNFAEGVWTKFCLFAANFNHFTIISNVTNHQNYREKENHLQFGQLIIHIHIRMGFLWICKLLNRAHSPGTPKSGFGFPPSFLSQLFIVSSPLIPSVSEA